MKKKYTVKRTFGVGECRDLSLKKDTEILYDSVNGSLEVDGHSYTAKNLISCIKVGWLVPIDGEYPEMDGPLGETEDEKLERKRKERLETHKKKNTKTIVNDERSVGVVNEDSDLYAKTLNAELVVSEKNRLNKKNIKVMEDDTREVSKIQTTNSDIEALKTAMNQRPKDSNIDPSKIKVVKDHYDAESKPVGTFKDTSNESAINGWAKMHWTKKAELINSSEDKSFLNKLKSVETSDKIQERIKSRLESLN